MWSKYTVYYIRELTKVFLQAKFLFFERSISLLSEWKISWYPSYINSSIKMASNETKNSFLHHVRD